MDVEIAPTRKVSVLGIDKRSIKDIAWCAATYGINRLYWIDDHVMCLEVYEKSFEHEIKSKELPISQVCYTAFPNYVRTYEIDKSIQIPMVNVSDMKIFKSLLTAILKNKGENTADSGSKGT